MQKLQKVWVHIMQKLTPNQTRWIMRKVNAWLDKYIAMVPMSDEQWQGCVDEMKELEHSAREDKLMIKMLIAGVEYLEELEKKLLRKARDKS